MGALCFVTLFGVVGAKPLPLGEPRVLIRSVKTHTGLLLTKVTKPCIMDSSKRSVPEVTRWSFKERFSVYTGGDGGTEN